VDSRPSKYYGAVEFDNGETVDSGEVISYAESREQGRVEFTGGQYEVVAERNSSSESYSSVSFVVILNGEEIHTGQSANFSAFDSQNVNLTIPAPETGDESDSTDDSDDGSGGGGGGGFTGANFADEQDNEKPVAGFTWDTPVRPGEEFSLDASGSFDPDGSVSSYTWSIGAQGETVETVFGEPGSYPVTLTVEDNEGASTNVTKTVVVEENQPPSAGFEVTYTGSQVLENVEFNASSSFDPDGEISEYRWSFGETGQSATESFSEAKTVNLTVVDNEGASTTVSRQLTSPQESEYQQQQNITGSFVSSPSTYVGGFAVLMLLVGFYLLKKIEVSIGAVLEKWK
jgi:hypothetical protein